MLMPVLLFAAIAQGLPVSVECGAGRTAATAALQSSSGIEVTLRVVTDDDHSKGMHDCQASYSLSLTTAAGGHVPDDEFMSSDGEWDRRISLRLEGFSQDQGRVVGAIAESGRYGSMQIFTFAVQSGEVGLVDLNKSLRHRLTRGCIASLTAIGTTADGAIVLAPGDAGSCSSKARWKQRMGKTKAGQDIDFAAERLPEAARVVPLDRGPVEVQP